MIFVSGAFQTKADRPEYIEKPKLFHSDITKVILFSLVRNAKFDMNSFLNL